MVGVQDASFDNLPGDHSQAGQQVLLADPKIVSSTELVPVPLMEWSSRKIRRVVRSTLAAEAYSMGENAEAVDHLRQALAELFQADYTKEKRDGAAAFIPGVLVTDARALYENLRKEGGAVRDRRPRLELILIRNIPNLRVKWIRSEMTTADEPTKKVSEEIHQYAKQVRETGRCTLALDHRAPPSTRNRAHASPEDEIRKSEMVAELLVRARVERKKHWGSRRYPKTLRVIPMVSGSSPSVSENGGLSDHTHTNTHT